MTRLWCKIMPKTNVEQTEKNEASYFYLYPFGDLGQESFQGGFMCASNKEVFSKPFLKPS